MSPSVNLVVPLKDLARAKSRLTSVSSDPQLHAQLVLAMAADTVATAIATPGVNRVVVVATEPAQARELQALGATVVTDPASGGLNGALRFGAEEIRRRDPGCVVGALPADLPALTTADLAWAIDEAGGRRAFCADRHVVGTTLLLSGRGEPLTPRFGPGSAAAHSASGAMRIARNGRTLRADVDTADDLDHVRALGVGKHTRTALTGLGEVRNNRG